MALIRHVTRMITLASRSTVTKNITEINFRLFTFTLQNFKSQELIKRFTSTTQPLQDTKEVKVTFVRASGERIEAKGKVGDSLLDIVVNNEIDLDGYGACEGTLTCSTCHLILPKNVFDSLPDKPTDEELDMLDLAYDLTETSRLGCQIIMTKELDGLEVRVPATINDARS